MKIKRFMAALLCSAMVLTSQSVDVLATEATTDPAVTAGNEAVTAPVGEEASDESTTGGESDKKTGEEATDEKNGKEDAGEKTGEEGVTGETGEEAESGKTGEEAAEKSKEKGKTEEGTSVDNKDITSDDKKETPAESEVSEDNVKEEEKGDTSVSGNETKTDAGKADDDTPEVLLKKNAKGTVSEDSVELLYGAGSVSEFLTVNAAGELTLRKPYTKLSATGAKSITIPKGTKVIKADTALFVNNNVIETVTFEPGSDVDEIVIETGAFGNSSIKTFTAPDNYYEIKANTFQNCTELVQFNFNNVKIVGDNAFNGCSALGRQPELLSGEAKIESIGNYAFAGTGFKTLNISSTSLKLISSFGVTVGVGAFSKCINLETAYVPKSFNKVPESCFSGCNKLKKVVISCAGVIEARAFENCSSLSEIDFGKVTEIKSYAFNRCIALKSVNFPETVVLVEANAFDGCDALVEVTFLYKGADGSVDRELFKENAFPNPAKITLKGYGGKLKDLANKYKFKDFKSLGGDNKIRISQRLATYYSAAISIPGKKTQSITTNVENNKGYGWFATVKAGDEVTLTLYSRTKGYDIVRNSLTDDAGDTEFTFVSYKSYIYTYKFTAQDHDTLLDLETYKQSDLNNGNVKYSIVGKNNATFVSGGGASPSYYSIQNGNGKKGQLYINTPSNDGMIPEMFTYKSSNTGVATISNTGLITVLKDGITTITATYKQNNRKISFELESNGSEKLDDDSMELTFDSTKGVMPATDTVQRTIGGKLRTVQVVTYDKSAFNTSSQTFTVKLATKNKVKENIYVKAKWTTGDTKIAKVASAENMDNSNTVTISRGATGETYVRTAVTTDQKDENGKNITVYAYLIVRISDIMPKVVEDNVKVNIRKSEYDDDGGSQVTLVPVKGHEIAGKLLSDGGSVYEALYQLKAQTYSPMDGLKLKYVKQNEYDQHVYRLIPTGTSVTRIDGFKKKIFSGDSKLYIRCANEGGDFYIPISSVTLVDEQLIFNVKPSGSINLFYNAKCYNPRANGCDPETELEKKKGESEADYIERYITATVGTARFTNPVAASVAELNVVELVDYPHCRQYTTNGAYKPANVDKLKNNFVIETQPNGKDFVIKRSANALMQEDGKDVTTGYLFFWFKGFEGAAIVPITIPTKNSAPGYALSPSSATDNRSNVSNAIYTFQVINKSNKRAMVTGNTLGAIELGRSTQSVYFENLNNASMDNEGIITLKRRAMAIPEGKATAPIVVKRKNWEKSVTYNFTVSISAKDPNIKLSPSTVKLDNQMAADSARIVLTSDQMNTIIRSGAPVYAGKGADPGITFSYESGADGSWVIKPAINGGVAKGSYKYNVKPTYRFKTAEGAYDRPYSKTLSFTVNVIDSQPTMKLGTTTFTFNVDQPERETYAALVTIGSVNVADDALIDVSNASLEYASSKADAYASHVGSKVVIGRQYNAEKKKNEITFKLKKLDYPGKFSYSYNLLNVTINGAVIKPVKITIKGIEADPSVSLRSSGSLNIVDGSTCLTYTATVKNMANPIIDKTIAVYEYNPNTGAWAISQRFRAVRDDYDQTKAYLYAILDNDIRFENTTYELSLLFNVSGVPVWSNTMKVKPSQNLPRLSFSPDKSLFVSALESKRQTSIVYLTKTSQLKSHINKIKLAESNSDDIKNAFTVYYVDGDKKDIINKSDKTCYAGYIVITCTAPEILAKGNKYNLILEAELTGQFQKKNSKGEYKKVNGPTIKIPVTVNR